MSFVVAVSFPAPVAATFALLSDPARRAEWQSSLRRVDPLGDGPPGIGTQWYDVTVAGLRPLMEITAWEDDRLWAERGRWHGVVVDLVLDFEPSGTGTTVRATASSRAAGWRRPLGWGLDRFGPTAARADLGRAARLLAREQGRSHGCP